MQKRWIACLLALLMILGLFACGGQQPAADNPAETEAPAVSGLEPLPDEYFLPKEDGKNQLTVYWKADSINFDTSDMWMWFPGGDGRVCRKSMWPRSLSRQ